MVSYDTKIRVRYGETDKMGVVYHGSYVDYYEVARTELMRSIGIAYAKLEEDGYLLPVLNLNITYKKTAYYDEILTIKTKIKEIPSFKIRFDYETINEKNELINTGEAILIFTKKETMRPCKPPEFLIKKIKKNWQSSV